ncbi:MAG: DUF2817 domain-containing protein [Leptospira sp.]|nr:DUF2817 domain-containing protein [Leptospira sp.]NCS93917.1 DUF2817 domain-containing protein [Leptospira sp.]
MKLMLNKQFIFFRFIVLKLLIANTIFFQVVNCNSDLDSDLNVESNEESLAYYRENYEDSRKFFRESYDQISAEYPNATYGSFGIPGSDSDLTVDYIFFASFKRNEKTLIITSGIHGGEAATGTAVQQNFIDKIYPNFINKDNTSVLIVHSLNPYGFRNFRRVTENNVDLNRNFGKTEALFLTKNEGYPKISDLLNPKGSADTSDFGNRFFIIKAIYNIATQGMSALKQAALQGQYEYPEGIYFGGQAFEPLRNPLDKLFREKVGSSKKILLVDLHTGYGERGKLHLFPSDPKNETVRNLTETIFQGYQIDWASNDDFYTVTGELSTHICNLFPQIEECIPMVFEFGTLNSQTTTGAIESIHRTILENQGFWNGYADEEEREKIRANYREMFFPSSSKWRTKVIQDSEKIWANTLPRF